MSDHVKHSTPHPDHQVQITPAVTQALHEEILLFARRTRPSQEKKLLVASVISNLRNVVRALWPQANVEIFGSFATGLSIHHSDVNLSVVGAPLRQDGAPASSEILDILANRLQTQEWCASIKRIPSASMPILKLGYRHHITGEKNSTPSASTSTIIPVDISIASILHSGGQGSHKQLIPSTKLLSDNKCGKFIAGHTGAVSQEYIRRKIQELPPLAPLVLLLKSFLDHKGLSLAYTGGLSLFPLTLLVTFYLERVDAHAARGLFSVEGNTVHASENTSMSDSSCSMVEEAAGALDRVLSLLQAGHTPYLGVLLLGFLQTFGFVIELTSKKVVLKGLDGANPGGFFERVDGKSNFAWIDDPLRPGVNIASSSFHIKEVQEAFGEMLHSLIKYGVGGAPLKCNKCEDGNCEELAAMRELPHIGRLM